MDRWTKKLEVRAISQNLTGAKTPDYKTIRDAFIARGMPFGKAYNAAIRYYRIFKPSRQEHIT